jgi:hypothetical protein
MKTAPVNPSIERRKPMSLPAYPHLFKPMKIKSVRLKNRLTMAPLYLGYAQPGGKISPLLLSHYQLMAGSGVALVVVENAGIDPSGSGSPRPIRCDHDSPRCDACLQLVIKSQPAICPHWEKDKIIEYKEKLKSK